MDSRQFDNAIRALDGAITRRRGLAAALGVLFGGALAGPAAAKRPAPAGICGEGKANRCKKNSECCTNYCFEGRCRCAPTGAACTAKTQCCNGNGCFNRTCTKNRDIPKPGPGPGPMPGSCSAQSCPDGCCSGTMCVPYAAQDPSRCGNGGAACAACDTGAGETCVLGVLNGVCGVVCNAGSCGQGCCADPITCVPWASQTAAQCGTGGGSCQACTGSLTCNSSGFCVP